MSISRYFLASVFIMATFNISNINAMNGKEALATLQGQERIDERKKMNIPSSQDLITLWQTLCSQQGTVIPEEKKIMDGEKITSKEAIESFCNMVEDRGSLKSFYHSFFQSGAEFTLYHNFKYGSISPFNLQMAAYTLNIQCEDIVGMADGKCITRYDFVIGLLEIVDDIDVFSIDYQQGAIQLIRNIKCNLETAIDAAGQLK